MVIKLRPIIWLVLISLSSCIGGAPKLKRSYLPQQYAESSIPWKVIKQTEVNLKVAPINLDEDRNRRLIRHWRQGYFEQLFRKRHPVVKVEPSDINNLEIYLNDVLNIYYISMVASNHIDRDRLREIVAKHIQCEPLSNLEIRFLMNADSPNTFSEKPLSMLMISAHELMLQIGAVPMYPKVISPHFRKQYGLPELKSVVDANIFSVKIPLQPPPLKQSGFAVCKKEQ